MGNERPYRDESWLRRKYCDERLSTRQMADEAGVGSHQTILRWLDKHGIERRERRAAVRERQGTNYAGMHTNTRGYEVWSVGGERKVPVHRLAAVAWFGWDAVVGQHVHHENGVPWDNRESNLRPMSQPEHMRVHAVERDMTHVTNDPETGRFVPRGDSG